MFIELNISFIKQEHQICRQFIFNEKLATNSKLTYVHEDIFTKYLLFSLYLLQKWYKNFENNYCDNSSSLNILFKQFLLFPEQKKNSFVMLLTCPREHSHRKHKYQHFNVHMFVSFIALTFFSILLWSLIESRITIFLLIDIYLYIKKEQMRIPH